MKTLRNAVVVALGATTLCLPWIVSPFISRSHVDIYHVAGETWPLFAAALLDFAGVWLLLTCLLLVAARRSGRLEAFIWSGVLLFPWILMKNLGLIGAIAIPRWVSLLVFGCSLLGILGVNLLWRRSQPSRFKSFQNLTGTMLAFAAVCGCTMLAQLVWAGWKTVNLNKAPALHASGPSSLSQHGKPRIIWILLDELSYQQVYEHRFPGLELPAFDALAATATVFTHTVPAGAMTEDAVPALLTGNPVSKIRVSITGQLSTKSGKSGAWQKFDQHRTVFQDALDAGYSTGVAGWFNPYCRLLPQVLDHCFWTSHVVLANRMVPGNSIFSNMAAPLLAATALRRSILIRLKGQPGNAVIDSRLHQADYHAISVAADRLLADPSIDFMLLHLPIPHPGGIYNRATGTLTNGPSTYIDNLALADKYLAHVRGMLEQRQEWDSSTIVVMGDHSWRTRRIWRAGLDWTREEEAASGGGQFDDRPAYIVKLPSQQKAARIDSPFAAIHTRALFDAIFTGRMSSPEELSQWVRQLQ